MILAATATSSGAAPSTRATLAGSVPPWATSANFKTSESTSDTIGFRVYLGWQNGASLQARASAVSDPSNAQYGQYLTPQQFRQQYAPSQANVNAVKQWLQSQGFSIDYTPQNNHYVEAEGTVAQAAAAFDTSFGTYSVQGLNLRSNTSPLSIPTSLNGMVSGVVGLDESAALVHNDIAADPNAPPSAAFVSATPCSTYWGQAQATGFTNPYGKGTLPYAPCGYTPQQVRGAYGISGGDGSGATVGVIDAYASPTIFQDVNTWSAARGVPPLAASQFNQVVAPGTFHHPESGGKNKQNPQGWYGEETLDVEAVHGMAPGASIVYIGAPNNFQDLDAALNHAVDTHAADILTNSYGFPTEQLPRGFINPVEDTLLQAAVEGIGVYFSSGDNSDESQVVGYRTADWPASSPWVTAVGGTSLAVGASNNYLFETGWGTFKSNWVNGAWSPAAPGFWVYGAGGGVSTLFAEPAYQQGIVPRAVFSAQGRTGRAVPDLGAIADPNTGYLIGQTQTFPDGTVRYAEYRIGGTSLSSPITAGIMALVDQARAANGKGRLGFANPALYRLQSSAFHDVTNPASTVAVVRPDYVNSVDATAGLKYSLRTMNQTLSLQTTAGWDDVTGRGTPASGFVAALSH